MLFSALGFENEKNPVRLTVTFSRMWFYVQQAEPLPVIEDFHQAPIKGHLGQNSVSFRFSVISFVKITT